MPEAEFLAHDPVGSGLRKAWHRYGEDRRHSAQPGSKRDVADVEREPAFDHLAAAVQRCHLHEKVVESGLLRQGGVVVDRDGPGRHPGLAVAERPFVVCAWTVIRFSSPSHTSSFSTRTRSNTGGAAAADAGGEGGAASGCVRVEVSAACGCTIAAVCRR